MVASMRLKYSRFGVVITLTVNGEAKTVAPSTRLSAFLRELSLEPKKVAVERNLEIVPKSTFDDVILLEGDMLEIVHFIGGG